MSAHQFSKSYLHLGLLTFLRRISAAVVVFATLRAGMFIKGTPLNEKYQALLIIVALLALILFRTPDAIRKQRHTSFWTTTKAVGWAWAALFAIVQ